MNQPIPECADIPWLGIIILKKGHFIWYKTPTKENHVKMDIYKKKNESDYSDRQPTIKPRYLKKEQERYKPPPKESTLDETRLIISSTRYTPQIDFNINGQLLIKGRSIPYDAFTFYERLLSWISDYCHSPASNTTIKIMLDYLNDGTMKYLVYILRELTEIKQQGHELEIKWYYEADDEHMTELVGFYSNIIDHTIKLIPVEKI